MINSPHIKIKVVIDKPKKKPKPTLKQIFINDKKNKRKK